MTLDVGAAMRRAIAAAAGARLVSRPNPWVGAVLVCADGREFVGATEAPGGRHAEIVALDLARAAGADVRGSSMVVTLEPCSHVGRTGPCTDRIIDEGVASVFVGVLDPDPRVAGTGAERIFVIGGAQIYAQAIDHADVLWITEIDADVEGDASFIEFDRKWFREISREHFSASEHDEYPFDIVEYRPVK